MGESVKLRILFFVVSVILLITILGCEDGQIYDLEDDISIEIVQPLDGSIIEGTIEVKAEIGSATNIQKLVILLDGEVLVESTRTMWKTTHYFDGVRELRGLIIDAEGNEIYSEPVVVTLQNSSSVNENEIGNPGFEEYSNTWQFHNAYYPTHEKHNDTKFARLYWHDSFIRQPLNMHFEVGQNFRINFWAKAPEFQNANSILLLAYRNESGRLQSIYHNIHVTTEWQYFEMMIEPPLYAGHFVELRLDSDQIDIDDVELVRIK